MGYPIRAKVSYPDHYYYTDKDIQDLISISGKAQAKLITTQKDFVRLQKSQRDGISPLIIEMDIKPNTLTKNILGGI